MNEKIYLKSEKPACKKLLFIGGTILVIFVLTMGLIMRFGYQDAIRIWFKYGDASWKNNYSSPHDYAMQDGVYYLLPACSIIAGVWVIGLFIVYKVLSNAYIIITNQRILGRTSMGDKFSYSLNSISTVRKEGKKINISIRGRGSTITLTHIKNCDEIVHALHRNKQEIYCGGKEPIPNKYVKAFENVDNTYKKEDVFYTGLGIGVIVFIISIIVLFFGVIIQGQRDNDYSDVFKKDPNTWTEDEKDYVNDFVDWFDKNN